MDLLQVKIEKAKQNLSQDTRIAIDSVDWEKIISEIKMKKGFTEDQVGVLLLETEILLSGLTSPNEYQKKLMDGMILKKADLELLLNELNELVFKKIKEKLIQIIEEKPKNESLVEKIENAGLVKAETDKRFVELSQSIQDIITVSNYGPKIYILGKENNLTIAETTELEELVVSVMLNEVPKEGFEARAQQITKLDPIKLKTLTDKINEQILQGIRNEILGTHNTPIQNPLEGNIEIKAPEIQVDTVPKNTTEEIKAPIKKSNFDSIVLNKLAGLSKNTGVTTEYSLNNLSKSADKNMPMNKTDTTQKIDPYRMSIDL